ncbi:hypothetical protein [Pukyongiella litopenaei]|uniref:Uncharacterized protein n=1 Tax=Pukyongiella litopenaei TaxID=2605946 RepID=A0A2S0MT35_9RHOB|nr:hypothetical protein [Pukyongiella litopenaei]AVO38853.1 hypothetical protein C6Y53_14875 [Pukyongiella litopenaei]
MIRALIAAALVAGSAATADTIPVRSGEHGEFTRLVFRLPAGTDWSLDPIHRGLRLELEGGTHRFDTDQVFRRIGRDRVAGFRRPDTGTGLGITLGCDCPARASMEGERHLVIDLLEPKPGQPQTLTVGGHRLAFPPERMSPLQAPEISLHRFGTGKPALVDAPPVPPARLAPAMETAVSSNISERRLLEQIDRAAAQGLLTPIPPSVTIADETPQESDAPGQTIPETAPAAVEDGQPQPRPLPQIVAVTAIDRDRPGHRPADPAPQHCIPDTDLDLSGWAGDEPFGQQVSRIRTRLYGEFDKLDKQAALDLARTYLHFGFGAEARRALDLASPGRDTASVLTALSHLLDQTDLEAAGDTFAAQQGCGGDVTLWAALGNPGMAADADPEAIQRGFARLPAHLRRHLGPVLGRRLLDAGQAELAAAILRTSERVAGATDPHQRLAEARADTGSGQDGPGDTELARLATEGSEVAPDALIELVDRRLAEFGTVAPDLPELVSAYAFEYRDTPLGPDLRRVRTLAMALAGRFADAFDSLREIDAEDTAGSVRSSLLQILTRRADDLTFLQYALLSAPRQDRGVTAEASTQTAQRLLDLGFAAEAWDLLTMADERGTPAQRLLRAETALDMGKPHRGLVELLGMDLPDADRLRARAMRMTASHIEAARFSAAADDLPERLRSLWLAGQPADPVLPDPALPDPDPSAPAESRTPRYAGIAALTTAIENQPSTSPAEPSLAHARDLLSNSETLRSDIDALRAAAADTRNSENS